MKTLLFSEYFSAHRCIGQGNVGGGREGRPGVDSCLPQRPGRKTRGAGSTAKPQAWRDPKALHVCCYYVCFLYIGRREQHRNTSLQTEAKGRSCCLLCFQLGTHCEGKKSQLVGWGCSTVSITHAFACQVHTLAYLGRAEKNSV